MRTAWISLLCISLLVACGKETDEEPSVQPIVGDWETVYPILQGVSRFNLTREGQQTIFDESICPANLPNGVSKDTTLVNRVAAGMIAFMDTPEGRRLVMSCVTGDDASRLWEDPCLPGMLAPSFAKKGVALNFPEDLRKACAASADGETTSALPPAGVLY